mmetsp:Transcript_91233/g.294910  ORF Transcript_91233/g.294910 Transcript_91233/m.294910 type:complete len:344 (+) Transcript_91233:1084-2115(+)
MLVDDRVELPDLGVGGPSRSWRPAFAPILLFLLDRVSAPPCGYLCCRDVFADLGLRSALLRAAVVRPLPRRRVACLGPPVGRDQRRALHVDIATLLAALWRGRRGHLGRWAELLGPESDPLAWCCAGLVGLLWLWALAPGLSTPTWAPHIDSDPALGLRGDLRGHLRLRCHWCADHRPRDWRTAAGRYIRGVGSRGAWGVDEARWWSRQHDAQLGPDDDHELLQRPHSPLVEVRRLVDPILLRLFSHHVAGGRQFGDCVAGGEHCLGFTAGRRARGPREGVAPVSGAPAAPGALRFATHHADCHLCQRERVEPIDVGKVVAVLAGAGNAEALEGFGCAIRGAG